VQIEVKIDASCREPKVVVVTDRMTEEVEALMKRLSGEAPQMIAGFRGDTAAILQQADIIRVYAAAGKVFAVTDAGEYSLRLRLYELEERLSRDRFVRISNSEIINLRKAKGFDLSFSGTICVTLSDGAVTYVSRRYVARIKQVLGI
jgi:DNA-binding LytR/AlgR family response regulator